MEQFRNFEKFITRINDYGMQTGIVKVIPPPEWSQLQLPLIFPRPETNGTGESLCPRSTTKSNRSN